MDAGASVVATSTTTGISGGAVYNVMSIESIEWGRRESRYVPNGLYTAPLIAFEVETTEDPGIQQGELYASLML